MNAKKLPPPRGLDQTRDAADALERRFTDPPPPPEPEPETPPPTEPRLRSMSRRIPDDRVRRTYYLDRSTGDALDAAVDRVHSACRGMVPRHQIIAALIRRGLDAEQAVIADLKTQLRAQLD